MSDSPLVWREKVVGQERRERLLAAGDEVLAISAN
jgi:hypothetical protein